MNFFIGDMHIKHKNVLSFDNRPFSSIEEHDEYLIQEWNNVVDVDDDVFLLGDISFDNVTRTIEVFKNLNGNKHLLVGNHDRAFLKNREFRNLFVEIKDYKELDIGNGIKIVLCHYPIPFYNGMHRGWKMLYGHVHNSLEWNMLENLKMQMEELYDKKCGIYNVGAMMPYIMYRPRTLEEILASNV